MQKDEIVKKVKIALRSSSKNTDILEEIKDVVDECLEELKRKGVVVSLDDPLILKACKAYAKANYGFEEDSDKYQISYESIIKDLLLSTSYDPIEQVEETHG
ncbi:hypothetical protein [Anaerorhabdus furcosa]|uniref:Phage gp6-like head-tail connector protein n=1 Tax=Anaerorhabdus furcosa TaxID=118967 RepID=A0A1T4M164_9FIRM|nr:hypothetical protein [Anaerorhabdus furcosa]SJZ60661.1 hypothetical protein SAMN02745191_1138 [Anaerorhabdus furcosa]